MKNKSTVSTWGFIMSVLGAAVGLGGIWGFPTKMNQYGGTFLIPFFIALIICAIPILLIEMTLGNKYRKNHVRIFEELANKPGKFFGFLQSAVIWLLSVFYSVLVAWSLLALIMGFLPGLTQKDYFLNVLIGQTNSNPTSFSQLGNISIWVLLSLIGVWILTGVIVLGGVTKGLDKANKILVPSLFLIIFVMMIYTMTLDGALTGLRAMFSFHSSKLLTTAIWTDAFGQAFFMLSTCTAAIIIFSSHAPKNQNNTNKTLVIAVATIIVALTSTCTVFATISAIAKNQNLPINEVFKPGPTLIFQVFPQIFAIIAQNTSLLVFSHILAIFFFLSIFFAGISSLIAMLETVVNPLEIEWKIKRYKIIILIIVISILVDILFIFNNSAALIDGLATWVAGIWQMIIGIFELIGVMWLWKCYPQLAEHNNKTSWFKWDKYIFKYFCLFIIPTIIVLNLGFAFYQLILNIQINSFVFLTIGTTIGTFVTLMVTAIFTYYQEISFVWQKIKKSAAKTNKVEIVE
ncbi:MAG: sodium-dependent transporter [Spiroplasma sp.]